MANSTSYPLSKSFCVTCESNHALANSNSCFACQIASIDPYAFLAARLRENKAERFNVSRIGPFLSSAARLILLDQSTQYSINKHCEQLRRLLLSRKGEGAYTGKQRVNKLLMTGSKAYFRRLQGLKSQLVHRLINNQDGKCFYCGEEIAAANCEIDTVHPVHFKHSEGPQPAYWFSKLNADWGNQVPVCSACNSAKCEWESRAMSVMWKWRIGQREMIWYRSPTARAPLCPPWPGVEQVLKWENEAERITRHLPLAAMWIARLCPHQGRKNRLADLEVGFCSVTKSVLMGCADCTSGLVRLGLLRKTRKTN